MHGIEGPLNDLAVDDAIQGQSRKNGIPGNSHLTRVDRQKNVLTAFHIQKKPSDKPSDLLMPMPVL